MGSGGGRGWGGENDIIEDRGGGGTTKTLDGGVGSSTGEDNGRPDTRKYSGGASSSSLSIVTPNKYPNETPSTTPREPTADIALAFSHGNIAAAEVGVDPGAADAPTGTPTAGNGKKFPSTKAAAPSPLSTIRTPRPCSTFVVPTLSDSEEELIGDDSVSDHGTTDVSP